MQINNDNEDSAELQKRIDSIGNISYFVYTNFSSTTIIVTAVTACVMMCAIAFLGEWYNTKWIAIGAFFGVAVIIISIILLYNYSKKQYYVECENGKRILVVGGFSHSRKYYVNNFCYAVKKGQVIRIRAKKKDTIKILFSQMKRNKIIRKVSGNKENFLIQQKYKEDLIGEILGGCMPVKYGSMIFVNGEFKKGCYTSTAKMNYTLYFKVVKNNIRVEDIVPKCILDFCDKNTKTNKLS